MSRILAVDSGLTVTKAVIFGLDGRQIGVSRCGIPQSMPAPRHVERDMDILWRRTATAIGDVLAATGTEPGRIVAVAATAHGDGLYLLDGRGEPLGPGIVSLDSRATEVIADWERGGLPDRALELTGQKPHVSAPSALLAWLRIHEPERFARIGHVLACKDWLRFRLTGEIGTDPTEASTAFTDVRTQAYCDRALELFGLSCVARALPPASHPARIVGSVTRAAAAETGLRAGTPVAAGLHDVTASALGIGAHTIGVAGIIAGTYSINACVSDEPRIDARWFCRNAIAPGRWNNMSISPASTANYDWFIDTFCAAERTLAERGGRTVHDVLGAELDAALERASSVFYHPYLFGSPFGAGPSAGFYGLRGWHERGDVLAALLEGVAFNHRHHVDALREGFDLAGARLTGGASRNPAVARLFADVLNMPVTVTDTDEAAAWGAALCAGASVGAYDGFDADPRDLDAVSIVYRPDPGRAGHYDDRYRAYRALADDMADTWGRLNAFDGKARDSGHG